MAQRTGALIFDERTDRYDIRFDVSEYYGGLHCGDCFDVFVRGKWKPTRMEMNATQEWYLVGVRAKLKVKRNLHKSRKNGNQHK